MTVYSKYLLALAFSVATLAASAQTPFADSAHRSVAHGAQVEYLFPEQVTLPAGKPSAVTLHFRIAAGFHINSHAPHDDAFIPTVFSIPDGLGVALRSAVYPAGSDITLPLDPRTKLSVYSGDFAIETRMVAERGNHLVEAKLRYQACDNNACMPPKTITVPIDVIGN